MKIVLIILFMIGNEPTIIDGLHPRMYVSEDICDERRQYIIEHMNSLKELPLKANNFIAVCESTDFDPDKVVQLLRDVSATKNGEKM